jgi:hypothetical protein
MSQEFSSTDLKEGSLYFFSSNRISAPDNHFFVYVTRTTNQVLVFCCCTSQLETQLRIQKNNSYPADTLVRIRPTKEMPFDKDTYVNCNSPIYHTIEEIQHKIDSKEFRHRGDINSAKYFEILKGLHASPVLSEEEKEELPPLQL